MISDGEVLVEYDNGSDELVYLKSNSKFPYTKLADNGFRLRKRNDAPAFSETVRKSPVAAVECFALDSVREFTRAYMQQAVVPELIAGSDFDEWFRSLVTLLKADGHYEIEEGGNTIRFKGDAVEINDDIRLRFRNAVSLKEKQKVCIEMLKMEEKGVDVDDAKEAAISFFNGTVIGQSNKMGARLEALFFLKQLDPLQYKFAKDTLFEEIDKLGPEDAAKEIAEAPDPSVRLQFVELVKEKMPDQFVSIIFMVAKRFKKTQRDWVLDALLAAEDKEPVKEVILHTYNNISTNMQPFVWLCKKIVDSPDKIAALEVFDITEAFQTMFKTLNNIHVTATFSSNTKEGLSISREEDEIVKIVKDNKRFKNFLKSQPPEIGRAFCHAFFACEAFHIDYREEVITKFAKDFPNLEIGDLKARDGRGEDNAKYTLTRETHDRYRAELDEINKTKLDEATKDIVRAREFGDISENAELNVAQDKQRALLGRKAELERILDSSNILDE